MNFTALHPFSEHPEKGTRVTPVFHVLDPIERTSAQVAVLKNLLSAAGDFLARNAQIGVEDSLPSEVRAAAAKTACLAFSQLDSIVDDMPRWLAGDEQSGALKALLSAETRRAESEALKARAEEVAVLRLLTPYVQQGGLLLQREDGKYVAVNAARSLMSVADTPQGAIDKFNREFGEVLEIRPTVRPKKPRRGASKTNSSGA